MTVLNRLGMSAALLLIAATAISADESTFRNGDFSRWDGDVPADWTVAVGANNGADAPMSIIKKAADGGLQLAGTRRTMAWRYVSQAVALEPGKYLRVKLQTKATGLRREGRQFDNCYAALILKDASGSEQSRQMIYPQDELTEQAIYVRAPATAEGWKAELMFFLSKTGQFEIKSISTDELKPEDSFRLLVEEMNEQYSHFGSKDVDWRELVSRYEPRFKESPDKFNDLVLEMLGELKDMHIWIVRPDGRRVGSYSSTYDANFDSREPLARDVEVVANIPNLGFVARNGDGYGIVSIHSLQANAETIRQFNEAFAKIQDSNGIIVDLRRNRGGSENVAQYIAGKFTEQRRAYAASVIRNGPKHDDFSDMRLRYIAPRDGEAPFTNPVVCLVGPGCVSSGEGMAMMFKSLPHAQLVGQPTRGASGNPQPIPLPNGTDVWFSRWVAMLPDGTPIEGIGISPDIIVEHIDTPERSDVTYNRAVELLNEMIDER